MANSRSTHGLPEYLGPSGRIIGNPLISVDGGRSSMLLRRWFWIQYNGSIPRGYFPRMKCLNRLCQAHRHMILGRGHVPYTHSPSEYVCRYNKQTIFSVRYFKGKVNYSALSRVFHLPKVVVSGICNSRSSSKLSLPQKWGPSLSPYFRG